MKLLDRARINGAVQSYDFWLDVRGVCRSRRRDLRRELHANLLDASDRHGARQAVQALGGVRAMAALAAPSDSSRPRWSAGLQAGAAAMVTAFILTLLTAVAWLDGARAAQPTHGVEGSITLVPGAVVTYQPGVSSFSVEVQPGWAFLALGILTFVLVARPWRALARRDQGTALPVASTGG